MMWVGESPLEASQSMKLVMIKAITKNGTWNVRTKYEAGKTTQVAKEIKRYDMQALGICKRRWNGSGMTTLASGEKIIYSGHPDENHIHTERVAIIMMSSRQSFSSRIMTRRFNSKGRKVTIIQCYAPTNNAEVGTK